MIPTQHALACPEDFEIKRFGLRVLTFNPQSPVAPALGVFTTPATKLIPIPPGPLTVLTPSLFEIEFPPFVACDIGYYYFYIGYTALNGNLYYSELESVTTPPVNVKGCVPQ